MAELTHEPEYEVRYNTRPRNRFPSCGCTKATASWTTLRLGLIPSWAKNIKVGFSGINGRNAD